MSTQTKKPPKMKAAGKKPMQKTAADGKKSKASKKN